MSGAASAERRLELPFTTSTSCLVVPPERPLPGPPPMLVALHGHGQSGERQRRWMGAAVPPHFASAWPDGFHRHEVRRPGRPIRIGHAWYLYAGDRSLFLESLAESRDAFGRLIDACVEALDADATRVWLAGFSQGAYLVHAAAVTQVRPVQGWIAQAGGFRPDYAGNQAADLAGRPVLLQHGERDEALPAGGTEATAAWLGERGADVSLRSYPAGHEITPTMASDAREWLAEHEPAR